MAVGAAGETEEAVAGETAAGGSRGTPEPLPAP